MSISHGLYALSAYKIFAYKIFAYYEFSRYYFSFVACVSPIQFNAPPFQTFAIYAQDIHYYLQLNAVTYIQ